MVGGRGWRVNVIRQYGTGAAPLCGHEACMEQDLMRVGIGGIDVALVRWLAVIRGEWMLQSPNPVFVHLCTVRAEAVATCCDHRGWIREAAFAERSLRRLQRLRKCNEMARSKQCHDVFRRLLCVAIVLEPLVDLAVFDLHMHTSTANIVHISVISLHLFETDLEIKSPVVEWSFHTVRP